MLRDFTREIDSRQWRRNFRFDRVYTCVPVTILFYKNGSSFFFFSFFFFLQVSASRYPVVVKLGHAHGGVGKARAETNQEFLDLASLAALANAYCTSEPYVDTKYDVHVQKIGNNYKAFMWVSRYESPDRSRRSLVVNVTACPPVYRVSTEIRKLGVA